MSYKPTKAELATAAGKTVPDLIQPGLKVLFCGINPGLYSGAVGHHFARPGNRFWPALHRSGFTPRQLSPFEEHLLFNFGCGITNIVSRATATAAELTDAELAAGARQLIRKIKHHHPTCIAFLGISAYRTAFNQRNVNIGEQNDRLDQSLVWVLPNPSGLIRI